MEDIAKGLKIAGAIGGTVIKAARSLQDTLQPQTPTSPNSQNSQSQPQQTARPIPPSPATQDDEATLFCDQCGTPVRPGKKFCGKCGAKLS
jgi:hypothetical protein